MKMSKEQLKALEDVSQDKCRLVYSAGDGWKCSICRMYIINALKSKKLVRTPWIPGETTIEVKLTPAGRKALEEARNGN